MLALALLPFSLLLARGYAAEITESTNESTTSLTFTQIQKDASAAPNPSVPLSAKCVDACTLSATQHIAFGGPDLKPAADAPSSNITTDIATKSGFDFNKGRWFGTTFSGFKAHLNLDLEYTAALTGSGEFVAIVSGSSAFPFPPLPVNMTVEWVVYGTVQSTMDFHVTTGFDVSLPDGAGLFISFPAEADTGTFQFDGNFPPYTLAGFDQATIKVAPFQTSTANLNATISLSLRPGFIITETATLAGNAHATGTSTFGVYPAIPSLEWAISQRANLTDSCVLPALDSKDPVYANLTKVETKERIDVVETGGRLGDKGVKANVNAADNLPKQAVGVAQPVQCFAFDDGKKTLVNPKDGGKVVDKTGAASTLHASFAVVVTVVASLITYMYAI